MKIIEREDIRHETVVDAYTCCKYIERKGHSLEEVNLGNVHEVIEELTDDHWLPITQVISENQIEGYVIE